MRVENLAPHADCVTKRQLWQVTGTQDTTSGLWTYGLPNGVTSGTIMIDTPGSILTYSTYMVTVDADVIDAKVCIALGNGSVSNYVEVSRSSTRLVTRVTLNYDSNVFLWIKAAGVTVTPRRLGLYTLDDWNAMQKLGLEWFDGNTMLLT